MAGSAETQTRFRPDDRDLDSLEFKGDSDVLGFRKYRLNQLAILRERIKELDKSSSSYNKRHMLLARGIFAFRQELIHSGLRSNLIDQKLQTLEAFKAKNVASKLK